MNDSPYQVLGDRIPRMLGRERLLRKLLGHLLKETPDHVCVVGPTLFGKSVLLNHLASHCEREGDHYLTSLYWDLRHQTPRTDAEFRQRFAEQVKVALKPVRADLAEYLDPEDEALFDLLHLVFEEMERERLRLLAVLDGFDHVLGDGTITRNFWDEMRALGQRGSLRLVTGSRRRLRELCKSEDSRTSDFWEIFFDTPIQVGCFEDDDWDGFLAPFASRGIELDSSARKEFANWTGGVPVLAAALASRVLAETREGVSLSKPDVDRIAETMAGEPPDALAGLWEDCPEELRSDLAELAKGVVALPKVSKERRIHLALRGYARPSRRGLKSSCRLMAEYAHLRRSEVENLRRMFGDDAGFEGNIRGLLELRLAQLAGVDPELRGNVHDAIRKVVPERAPNSLPKLEDPTRSDPTPSTVWARSIAERALDLIWDAEIGSDRSLPDEWKSVFPEGWAVFKKWSTSGQFPQDLGPQCGILRHITGTQQNVRVTKFITKPTSILVDHIQSVGNFGQHRQGQKISIAFAAAFCMSAVSLCERLTQELP